MSVLDDVADERKRQDHKWGVQSHMNGTGMTWLPEANNAKGRCERAAAKGHLTWTQILDEEVLEAFCETNPVKLRTELIQVAAVAVAWVEHLDRLEAARKIERPAPAPSGWGFWGNGVTPPGAVGNVEA